MLREVSVSLARRLLIGQHADFCAIRLGLARGCRVPVSDAVKTSIYLGVFEYEIAPFFKDLVRPGCRCFDVGGGADGYYALVLARLSGTNVVVFEPNSQSCKKLDQIGTINQAPITVVNKSISSRDSAEALTLSTAAARYFVPDFIKIDIEGAEVAALQGAKALLQQHKPHLIVETHSRALEDDCIHLLAEFGYSPQIVGQRRLFKEDRPIEHNRWLICARAPLG